MTQSHLLFETNEMNFAERIVNVTPESLVVAEVLSEEGEEQLHKDSHEGPVTNLSAVTRGKEGRRGATETVTKKPTVRLSSQSTDTSSTLPTEAETLFSSASSFATNSSLERSTSRRFFKTPSQRKLQEQLFQKRPQMTSGSDSHNNSGSFLSTLRLDQEEVEEGFHDAQLRRGIENARRNLSSMR
jgi:hypothetical protein